MFIRNDRDSDDNTYRDYNMPGDWTLDELESLPTLAQGQADDLKHESDDERVWLSRCSVGDGEPCDDKVTIEQKWYGKWLTMEEYPAA